MKNRELPLVSIVVPSYNYEIYVGEALESIFNQTYEELELIIVDDNSKDKSCYVIDEIINTNKYKARFKSDIQFIRHVQNQGAHSSINEGIRVSKGRYVTILNADDLFEPNRIEELVKNLLNLNSDFAFSKINVIDAEGNDISAISEQASGFIKIQESIGDFPSVGWSLIPHNTAISTGNMLFSRELFNKIGGFRNLKYCHDWDFALRCLLITEPIFVQTTHYFYRLHGSNTFLTLNDVVDQEVKTVLGSYFRSCKNKNIINKLAPSITNWQDQFIEILKKYSIINFWYYSKTFSNWYLQFKQNRIDHIEKKVEKK